MLHLRLLLLSVLRHDQGRLLLLLLLLHHECAATMRHGGRGGDEWNAAARLAWLDGCSLRAWAAAAPVGNSCGPTVTKRGSVCQVSAVCVHAGGWC